METSSVRSRHHSHTNSIISPTQVPCTLELQPTNEDSGKMTNQLLQDVNSSSNNVNSEPKKSNKFKFFVLFILLLANLINYMDRYTIAGVLEDVQKFYEIDNSQAGLLQTSFIISYMCLSPIFGYIGDRFNRKWPMVFGVLFWSVITLCSSFVPRDSYLIFLLLRAMVGIGEASYSTIAPTIIADMFSKTLRTKALSIFYFAIPVGSGLGYIVGSKFAAFMGEWFWALRVTPPLGIFCALLVAIFVSEPGRGASEGAVHVSNTSLMQDICALLKHKSFIFSTLGFTCVTFVAGGLAFWAPMYVYRSQRLENPFIQMGPMALCFGVITVLAGLAGVAGGFALAAKLRPYTQAADPLICAAGLILGAPFLYLSLIFSRDKPLLTWIMIFIGETLISLNWALVTDILLYTVIPTRRSMAEALQILISHMFGDAGSPYLLGLVSDLITKHQQGRQDNLTLYLSLQYSLYVNCFICVLGGGFFLLNSLYVKEDKERTQEFIRDQKESKSSNNGSISSLEKLPEDNWKLKTVSNGVGDGSITNGMLPIDAGTEMLSVSGVVGVLVHNESQQKLVPTDNRHKHRFIG